MTPANVLYQDGVAAAATGHACPDCPESRTGYLDSITDIMDITDYQFGRELFGRGQPLEACLSEEQRDGWQDAAADGFDAYLACAQEDGGMDVYAVMEQAEIDHYRMLLDDEDEPPYTFNRFGDRIIDINTGW